MLLEHIVEGAYEIYAREVVETFHEYVWARWCKVVHGGSSALAMLGKCIIGAGVLNLERWAVQGELSWGGGGSGRDEGDGGGCVGARIAFRGGRDCLAECGRAAGSAVMKV
jgi:hypothetical protein